MDQNNNDSFELSKTLGNINDATVDNNIDNSEVEVLDVQDVQTNSTPINNNMNRELTPNIDSNPNAAAFDTIPNDYNPGDIGSVPPMDIKEKKPKKKNKVLFVFLIFLFIGLIGGGLFYFLRISKGSFSHSVTPKNLELEMGTSLPTDINEYATFKSVSASNCILDTRKVDTTTAGKYEFTISCGNKLYTGSITLKDTLAPDVKAKNIVKTINTTVTPEEFIANCDDATECTYAFANAEEIENNLKTAGNYDVSIIVKDKSENETTITAKLIVINSNIKVYLNCSLESSEADFNGTYTKNDKIGINTDTSYAGIYFQVDEYIASTQDVYNSIKQAYEENKTLSIHNGEGIPVFDDSNLTIKFEEVLSGDAPFGKTYSEIRNYYEVSNGYKCNIINVN